MRVSTGYKKTPSPVYGGGLGWGNPHEIGWGQGLSTCSEHASAPLPASPRKQGEGL